MLPNLFFDLDGTLLDPSEGFALSLAHAFESCGLVAPSAEILKTAIGPPADEWSNHFGASTLPAETLPAVIQSYRSHYEAHGLFKQAHYPGMFETLQTLARTGHSLSIATSKPQKQAELTLTHFGLEPIFRGRIFGRDLSQPGDKTTILAAALQATGHSAKRSLMIGDRKFDCHAARNLGLKSIGVLYGFGSLAELQACNPDGLCERPEEL
ncbi:MAG: HAD hydrolase-like protein, partial [Oligoflexia bacterium]